MLEIKTIIRIVRVMGYGMSNPIHIIADDNKDYILKTKIIHIDDDNNLQISSKELFVEIFSYLYLKALNALYIPNACLLELTEQTLCLAQKFANGSQREKQALQNLENSKGLNLGVEYIENANKPFSLNEFSAEFTKQMINYDARLMNTDRDLENPNILEDLRGKKWLIDFGLAFDSLALFDNLISKTRFFEANEIYFDKCCFTHYIFNEITRKSVAVSQKRLSTETIQAIISYLCEKINLLDDSNKEYLAQIIANRQASKRIFCE